MLRTDQPLPIKVRIWLSHKVILSQKTNHYKNPEIAKSLQMCQEIAKMVRRNCTGYNTTAICNMILSHQKHLRNILPDTANNSYKSSLEKLEDIFTAARLHLQRTK